MTFNPDQPLDRLWAATRPEEPSADTFDRLWTNVEARAAKPETPAILEFTGWKSWGLKLAIVAQAAALLIAGFVALNRHNGPTEVAASRSKVFKDHDLRVEEGQTLFAMLGMGHGGLTGVEPRPQIMRSDTDMVAVETDVLSFMEAFRNVPDHDLRVKEGATLFVSIDGIGELASIETRPQVPGSETDVVAVESDVLNFMESLK